ncbi:ATP-binding protein [Elongatibacter sediminis]|uniref:AAA family ATPase n=1 Tax=Elongatibacter sediminis TaxID=3119006 RepID=A0AAW9R8Z5_9GAMM
MDTNAHALPALQARSGEQEALEVAISALHQGRGEVIFIVGEPGIGKSALARWAAARARQSGIETSWGFSWEASRAPPYWPWMQCLREILQQRDLPEAVKPHLQRLLPELASDPYREHAAKATRLHADQARFQLLDSARRILRATATTGPFVAILEDLHAADHDSLLLLRYLCPLLNELPVLLVGTWREGDAQLTGKASLLGECARSATVMRPRALDMEAVNALLKPSLEDDSSGELASQVHALTEGNPLFVTEISALLRNRHDTELPTQLPANLQQVIRQHFGTLPPDCRDLLGQASVLGREFDIPTLAALTEAEEASLQRTLQPAVMGGLLRHLGPAALRYTHIFYRDILYLDLDPTERMRLHRVRAEQLSESLHSGLGGHWSELAEHLTAAGSGSLREAARAWQQAARHARERLAFTEACQVYRKAVEAFGAGPGADPVERCSLILEWARVELEAGNLEAGRKLCDEVFALAGTLESPRLMAEAALTYGRVFVIASVDPVLVRYLRRALQVLPGNETGLHAQLQARLAAALQPDPEPDMPVRMAHEAIELARETGDSEVLFDTLASAIAAMMDMTPVPQRTGFNREFADMARAAGEITAEFRGHALLMVDAMESGDPAAFDLALDTLERLARRIDLPHYDWKIESAQALRAQIRGQFEAASAHNAAACEHARKAQDNAAEMTLAIQALCLEFEAGTLDRPGFDRLRQRITEACTATGSDDLFIRPVFARYLLAAGDRAGADALCGPGAIDRLIGMREISNITNIGECAVMKGDRDLARRIIPLLEPQREYCAHASLYGMAWHGPIAHTLARLLRVAGSDAEADRLLSMAESVAERMGAATALRAIRADYAAHSVSDATGKTTTTPAPGCEHANSDIRLVCDGEVYRLSFRGRTTLLQPTRGMAWLEQLVNSPDREWHVLDLVAPGEATPDAGGTGPLLDHTARDAYRKRLEDLDDELEEARLRRDDDLEARLLDEQNLLRSELGRAFGLGGRERPAGKAAERARVNVTRRVRDAIRRIGEQDMDAGNYLDKTIKTGRFCSFQPL